MGETQIIRKWRMDGVLASAGDKPRANADLALIVNFKIVIIHITTIRMDVKYCNSHPIHNCAMRVHIYVNEWRRSTKLSALKR